MLTQIESACASAKLFLATENARVAKFDLTGADLAQGGQKVPEQGNPAPFDTSFQGIPIHVDRPKGFKQVGKGEDGKEWERTYLVDYGYVPGVKALLTPTVTDEEELDVFLGPNNAAKNAYVVLQVKADGKPDELKVMLGWDNPDEAKKAYTEHVPERFFGGMAGIPMDMLKAMLGVETIEASKAIAGIAKVLWATASVQKVAGLSYEEVSRSLREKLCELYPPDKSDPMTCYPCGPYIVDTFDDNVVFEIDGKLMRTSFVFANGVATFVGEPEQVFRAYVPAQKSEKFVERSTRLIVAKSASLTTAEEQYVLGIVLEPETVDAQGDIYSEAEIKAASREFMRNFRNVGLMHKALVNGRANIVDNFVALTDMEIEGTKVRKGTWLLGLEITDAELWGQIKKGELTGLSIGGFAKRTPVVA